MPWWRVSTETKDLCIFFHRNWNIYKNAFNGFIVLMTICVQHILNSLLLHSKKLPRDYWMRITDKHCVKISVWDFCGGSVKVSTLGSTVTLLLQWRPPAKELQGRTSKLSREAFWQADLMQSLNWEIFFFFLQEKDRKGRVCERQSVSHLSGNSTVTWKRVSITCVKSYYMRLKWQIMLSVGLSMSLHAGSPPMKGSDKSQNEWLTTEQDVSK